MLAVAVAEDLVEDVEVLQEEVSHPEVPHQEADSHQEALHQEEGEEVSDQTTSLSLAIKILKAFGLDHD